MPLEKFKTPQTGYQGPPRVVNVTIQASLINNRVNLSCFEQVAGQAAQRSWEYDAEDAESFILPADLHQSTKNMLIGVGQRLKQLQLHGFEREP